MNIVKSTIFQIIRRKELVLFIVLIIAGITLCGWIFDNIALVSFSLKYKPISPIIAGTFIVLSIIIYINLNFEKSRLTKSLVTLLFIIITLFYGILVLGYVFNFAHGIENVFVKNADKYGSALTGYMSPIAAFLGFSICISSLLVSRNHSDIIKYFGGSITLLVFLFSSVLLIAYLYNAPLLFGSQVVPVALPAVVCFLLFSITLLRIYELKFWTFNLIKDNTIALRLLKSFLPIVVLAVIVQGLLISNLHVTQNNLTLLVTLILFIVIVFIVFMVIKASMDLGYKFNRAEHAIRESESSLRDAQEIAKMSSWEWDMVTQKINWSGGYLTISGFKSSKVEPSFELFRSRIHSDDIHFFDEMFAKVMKDKRPFSFEIRLMHPDGTIKWIQNNLSPVIEYDKLVKLKGIIIDINDRKQAELALKESEAKFHNLFNNSEVGMFRTRFDGSEILEFNKKYLKILGYTFEEVKGKSSKDMWANKEEHMRMGQSLKAEGHVTDLECDLLTKQGNVINCITSLRLYPNGILEGSIIDITARKMAEKLLEKERRDFQTILDLAPVMVAYKSKDDYFVNVNSAFAEFVGLPKEEIIGKTTFDIVKEEDVAKEGRNHDLEVMRTGIPVLNQLIKWSGSHSPNSRWGLYSKSPFREIDGSIIGTVSFIQDIDERVHAEEALKESETR